MATTLDQEHEIDDTATDIPDPDALANWLDVSKALRIGTLIDQVKRSTSVPAEGTPNKQMNEFFIKTIHSMPLDNTLLLNMSIEAEPLY